MLDFLLNLIFLFAFTWILGKLLGFTIKRVPRSKHKKFWLVLFIILLIIYLKVRGLI